MELERTAFRRVSVAGSEAEAIRRPTSTYWQDVWRRFRRNQLAMAGLVMLVIMVIMSLIGPLLTHYTYYDQNLLETDLGPSSAHWFGTDDLGRDMFTRLWVGGRISIFIGITAALLDLLIGVLYGGISGYFGGRVDDVMMRIVEVIYGIPYLLLVILLLVVVGPGLSSIILAMVLTGWVGMARLVRGQVLQLKEQEFILAARTLGANPARLILRHLIPNTMGPILVSLTLTVPAAIFTEAFLSFIGLGVPLPLASWGTMVSEGYQVFRLYPWQLFFPAIAISLTMLGFNVVGDGLRDALDPRLRK